MTELTDTEQIDESLEDLKAINITIPYVTLTNQMLTSLLIGLDQVLSPSVLNFNSLINQISGSIVVPDLRVIRDGVESLNEPTLADEVSYADYTQTIARDKEYLFNERRSNNGNIKHCRWCALKTAQQSLLKSGEK